MKILIFNWRDMKHPLAGGAEMTVYYHAKYWQSQGADITWFSSGFEGGKEEDVIEGMKIIRRGSHYSVHLIGIYYYLTGKLGRPDIVLDCFHFIPFYTPLYIHKKKIIALIHEVADTLWFKNIFMPIAVIGYLLERFSFIFYKNVQFITVSDSTKQDLIRHRIPSRNISVIFNGSSSPARVKKIAKEKLPTITFLGRISPDKGIEDALEAFNIIADTDTTVRLWIIGKEESKGVMNLLIEKIINQGEARKRIHYWGYVSEEKKFEMLKKSWILIHPSEKEGWGLTVIEAASQGTPTVGYNVGGLKDSILDNKTGMLTDSNPRALSEGVLKVLYDKKKYTALSLAAKSWAQEFDWEKSSKKSYEIIKKMIA